MKRNNPPPKGLILLIAAHLLLFGCATRPPAETVVPVRFVRTFAGASEDRAQRFGEPFGAALKNGVLYVSDGEQGKIWRVARDGAMQVVTDRLNTPSAIAFDAEGFLIVADAGTHTIKRVNAESGEVSLIAGVENRPGFADGDAAQALFRAPVGVAVSNGKIYVADTYNDRIRVIENGTVATLAGGERGFADAETSFEARFDTPCGVAVLPSGALVVADTGNRRLRLVEQNGRVSTLAGTGDADSADGLLHETKFVEPAAVAVDRFGAIYVADGNSVRALNRHWLPFSETLSDAQRGFADGALRAARFNRPAGIARDEKGNLFVTDAENGVVRIFTGEEWGAETTSETAEKLKFTPEEFRALQPPRWTYDPPEVRRDVAGTLGEIRGAIAEGKNAWFHNGLDIAGAYGETARFLREEKVLRPVAAEGFGGLRERLRLPTVGYIHIRLGRDRAEKPFDDARFLFARDTAGKLSGVRVPRGARFRAGEPIGTLNSFNHVHLVAGKTGAEMNALDALVFPNIEDTISPKIEAVELFDENWREINETPGAGGRKRLMGKTRVIVRAFDQMNGGAAYRKLGVYRLGYQIFGENGAPAIDLRWTISFAEMPDEDFVPLVYAPGSQSGYTPQTIFKYIVTNEVAGATGRENFLDAASLAPGNYVLRVFAADFFGNTTTSEINFSK